MCFDSDIFIDSLPLTVKQMSLAHGKTSLVEKGKKKKNENYCRPNANLMSHIIIRRKLNKNRKIKYAVKIDRI